MVKMRINAAMRFHFRPPALVILIFPIWVVAHDRRGAVFVIFCLCHKLASLFPSPFSVFLRQRGAALLFLGFKARLLPATQTPPPWFPVFPCIPARSAFSRTSRLLISTAQWLQEWHETTFSAPPPPPSGRPPARQCARPSSPEPDATRWNQMGD